MHLETIKAELRMRHGTVQNFAKARGLVAKRVFDVLRGRVSRPIATVIAEELNMPLALVFPVHQWRVRKADVSDTKPIRAPRHRQNSPPKLTGETA